MVEAWMYVIPVLVWIAVCKVFFHVNFSWGEVGLQAVITVIVITTLFLAGHASQTSDVMFVNGRVESTEIKEELCPRGWRDFRDSFCTEYRTRQVYSHTTCTGTGSEKLCTKHYDTEYKYIYPWERKYFVYADIDTFEISRVDPQGAQVPERFAQVQVGDPVTKQISFVNYIKGASDSLFNEAPRGDDVVLAYPRVKDYYFANRVLVSGTEFDPQVWRAWNQEIMQLNTDLAPTGANVILVVTEGSDAFADMLARAWDAHNINDVVVVLGLKGGQIEWVDVASWSRQSTVNLEIRDEILKLETLDKTQINTIIKTAIEKNFRLRDMAEFEYLADDIRPPTWVYIVLGLFLLIVTPAITYVFHKYDVIK